MRKHILFAALIATVLSLAAFGFVKSGPGSVAAPPPQAENADPHSLREKARSVGQLVIYASPNGVKRFDDAAALTRQSALVVTGTVEKQAAHFHSLEERSIVTDFKVRVKDVLKGAALAGGHITVREPGGLVQFEDGTSADVRMPEYWRSPAAGKSYAFFLKQKGAVYMLFAGPQGLFELSPAGRVLPQARAEDALTQKYNGKRSADFFEEIRQAAQQP